MVRKLMKAAVAVLLGVSALVAELTRGTTTGRRRGRRRTSRRSWRRASGEDRCQTATIVAAAQRRQVG